MEGCLLWIDSEGELLFLLDRIAIQVSVVLPPLPHYTSQCFQALHEYALIASLT